MPQSCSVTVIDAELSRALTALVARAGAAILSLDSASLGVRTKADQSPVTAADHLANAILLEGLQRVMPGLPVVSEERIGPASTLVPGGCFALVDPLDGTKEFIAGRDEFTVNLAIMKGSQPIAGFVAVPALGLVYRGIPGQGAERIASDRLDGAATPIAVRKMPARGLVALVSRSHLDPATDAFLTRLPTIERVYCGSALKFCRIAEGAADLYPRLAETSEWDIAAGHAIIAAAGGVMTTAAGQKLAYGRAEANFIVPDFVAWGDPAAARLGS